MDLLQAFSVSHNPEFFRLCVFLLLMIMIWRLEKLNKSFDSWFDLFQHKIDALPVDEDLATKLQYSYTSGFDRGYRKAIDDFDIKFERQEEGEASKVN